MILHESEEIGRDQMSAICLALDERVELKFVLTLVLGIELASGGAANVFGVMLPPLFRNANGKADAHAVGAWEVDAEGCVRDGSIACHIADIALKFGQSTDDFELLAEWIGTPPKRLRFRV